MGKALNYVINLFYSLVRNTLPGTTGYHRALTHVDSVDGTAIFNGVASRLPGQTAAVIELFWNALIEVIIEYMVTYQYRLSVCGNTFALAIPGSAESVNGKPSEEAYVSITPSAAMRNAVSGIRPVYRADETDTPVLKSVGCLAGNVLDQISGTDSFRLTGSNISAEGDDETITVIAADGTEAIAEVTEEDGYGMFITAHLQVALPPGKGKVVLMTHGKRTPEGELHQCVKSVTIIAGETPSTAPVVESAYPADHETDTENLREGEAFMIEGRNFLSTELSYQSKRGEGDWSAPAVLDGDEEYHRDEEGTSIQVYHTTVSSIIREDDLGNGDLVRFTITNLNDGSSASIVRSVLPEE